MSENEPRLPSGDFDSRLRAARAREEAVKAEKKTDHSAAHAGIGFGFRISIEFVAAVAVGTVIGYGLDSWLGTRPFLMVLFLLLGSVAGVLNAYRTVKGYDASVGLGAAQRRAETQKKPDSDVD